MKIPDVQTVVRPLLEHLEDGTTRSSTELNAAISDDDTLTEAERVELLPQRLPPGEGSLR